jgi:predicted DNA-binding transcriptional regulator AlpA
MELFVEKEWITKKELCAWLGVAPATVDRWNYDPRYADMGFPARRRVGYKVYWKVVEVRAWMESHFEKT